jgi:hypothetical protein
MFLGWFDDSKKKTPAEKIEEAVERYIAKFGEAPAVCLVNEADATEFRGLEVKVAPYVQPNHFWVGREEPTEQAEAGPIAA